MSDQNSDLDLRTVLKTNDLATLTLAEGALESAEIPYLAKGEQIQDLFGFGRMVPVNPVTGPVEIQVRAEDEKRALELLAQIFED